MPEPPVLTERRESVQVVTINRPKALNALSPDVVAALETRIAEIEKDDPELPDLLFRLAEMYSQQQRYWRFRYMEMFGKIVDTPIHQRVSPAAMRCFRRSKPRCSGPHARGGSVWSARPASV